MICLKLKSIELGLRKGKLRRKKAGKETNVNKRDSNENKESDKQNKARMRKMNVKRKPTLKKTKERRIKSNLLWQQL